MVHARFAWSRTIVDLPGGGRAKARSSCGLAAISAAMDGKFELISTLRDDDCW
jgi:hypothetical protein